jgi:5-methylcytosine-specific restriction enzyme A
MVVRLSCSDEVLPTWSPCRWWWWLRGRTCGRPMPERLRYSCRWPICPERVARCGYCPKHCATYGGGSGWAQRPSSGDYRGNWPALRKRVLTEEPNCRLCGAPATEVDHILPIAVGGTHERANLRSLCQPTTRQPPRRCPENHGA